MLSKRVRPAVAAAALLAASAGISSAAVAEGGGSSADLAEAVIYDTGTGPVDTRTVEGGRLDTDPSEDDSLRESAELWAQQEGIPAQTAYATMRDQSLLSEFAGLMAELYPREYAGSWFNQEALNVRFKGDVPADAASRIPSPLMTLSVKFHSGTGFSLAEAADTQSAIFDELTVAAPNTGVTLAYDPEQAVIEAWVTASTAAEVELNSWNSSVPLQMHLGEKESEVDFQVARGGGRMKNSSGGVCTSGFSVYLPTDLMTAMTTAAHCRIMGGGTWQYANPGGSWISASRVAFGFGTGNGDVEVFNTPQVEKPRFYQSANTHVPVSGFLNVVKGAQICKYGRVGGQMCSKVKNANGSYSANVSGLGTLYFNNQVFMANKAASKDGDSGGPWFKGQKVAGVHSARVTLANGNTRLAFTPVGAVTATVGRYALLDIAP